MLKNGDIVVITSDGYDEGGSLLYSKGTVGIFLEQDHMHVRLLANGKLVQTYIGEVEKLR